MFRNMICLIVFGLMVGGCASDGKMEASDSNHPTGVSPSASSNPAMVGASTAESSSTSPQKSGTAATESNSTKQPGSSKNRIAAGIDEETLDTCLAQIPGDATTGQRMLAEQTCRRNFSTRR